MKLERSIQVFKSFSVLAAIPSGFVMLEIE